MNSHLPCCTAAILFAMAAAAQAQVPDNLVVEGVPALPPALRQEAGRYLEFRSAAFQSWHPQRCEMLITVLLSRLFTLTVNSTWRLRAALLPVPPPLPL